MSAPDLCDCRGLKRPHLPGVRWCYRPAHLARTDDAETPRPRWVFDKAAEATTWHVRLGEAWGRCHRGTLVGLVRRAADRHWLGRHYVPFSPAPSTPVPPAPTREQAAEQVVDAWMASDL